MVKITILAVNNQQYQTNVDLNLTVYQFKEYIYQKVVQSLGANEMQIMYAGVTLQNDKQLSFYKIPENSANLKIIQTKANLEDVISQILAYEQDPISCEVTTCRMPCGHIIGRDCMTGFLRSLISAKKYEIKCPSVKPDGTDCQCVWEYKLCRTVGVLTQEEKREFQDGLTKNWMDSFTSECPNCKFAVSKGNLQSNRVICPNCGYGDFCYSCLHKWVGKSMTFCGNQECRFINEFLKVCPWDRKFKLKTNGVVTQYSLPKFRSCPSCKQAIQNIKGCKHMACPLCKKGFCWVCLGVQNKGKYPCGSYADYCGKIAPTQQITF